MESLRDEIPLRGESGRISFHLKPQAEDFIRAPLGFHRAKHDFIEYTRLLLDLSFKTCYNAL